MNEDDQQNDSTKARRPLQKQEQPLPFRFLSHGEFNALATEEEKLAYVKRAMLELDKVDPTKRRD
jgi:hypothetical protein